MELAYGLRAMFEIGKKDSKLEAKQNFDLARTMSQLEANSS